MHNMTKLHIDIAFLNTEFIQLEYPERKNEKSFCQNVEITISCVFNHMDNFLSF